MDMRIGAQLFTVRDFTKTIEDFDKSLEKIAKIGYKTIQLSAIGPFSAEEIKTVCDKHGLTPICTHRPWDEYCNSLDELIEFHKKLNIKYPGIGAIPKLRDGFTWEQVVEFVDKMNEIAAELNKHGLEVLYHHHDAEFVKIDGKRAMDYIIENGKFDFIVDVYWVAASGIDPARFLKRLGTRAKLVHFKDYAVVPSGKAYMIEEVMEGNLDWDSIIKTCSEIGTENAFVELDTCKGDPFDSLEISYKNLQTKGFC